MNNSEFVRFICKNSTQVGSVPTIPTETELDMFLITDILEAELYWNPTDLSMYTRSDNEIVKIMGKSNKVFQYGSAANITINTDTDVLILDTSSNAIVVTMPSLTSPEKLTIKKEGINDVTFNSFIDGAAQTLEDPINIISVYFDITWKITEYESLPPIPNPTSVIISNESYTSMDVDWTPGTETDWEVRYTPSGGSPTVVSVSPSPTTTLTGLDSGTDYDIEVRGFDGLTYSNWTTIVVGTTLTIPTVTNLITTDIQYEQFTYSFDPEVDMTGYNVEYKEVGGTVFNNNNSLTVTGLTQGLDYEYRVQWYLGSNEGVFSSWIPITTNTIPPVTSLTTTDIQSDEFTYSFDSEPSLDGFNVEYKEVGGSTFNNNDLFTVTGLTQGTDYEYRVQWRDMGSVGVFSSWIPVSITSTSFILQIDTTLSNQNDVFRVLPQNSNIYTVDWGDGNTDISISGDKTHTYTTGGVYKVEISGDFPGYNMYNDVSTTTPRYVITDIVQWGDSSLVSMINAFAGCMNMDISATDTPNLTSVTDMGGAFSGCSSLSNPDFSLWDVSNINNLFATFNNTPNFNGDITTWDTSSVTNMEIIFQGSVKFNQPIGGWNTSLVTNMDRAFRLASIFNQDIGLWDVSNVLDVPNNGLTKMFSDATDFNQDLSGWCVSNYSQKPVDFDTASGLTTPNLPVWGTCP